MDHDMPGMRNPMNQTNSTDSGGMMPMRHHKMMMHMTFFWGKNAEILFSGWPGTRTGMYVSSLLLVFLLSVAVEWLSHCRLIDPGSRNQVGAGLIQTLLHTLRVGLGFMVMLAVMSFNGGVFMAAVAGHSVGFLLFGSRVFKKPHPPPPSPAKTSDLPLMAC